MSQILIDISKIANRYTGLGEVSYRLGEEIICHIKELNNMEISPVFFLRKRDSILFKKFDSIQICHSKTAGRFSSLFNPHADAWHSLHQNPVWLPTHKTKLILTIHDLNFLFEKSDLKIKQRIKKLNRLLERTDVLTCVSKYTADCIREYTNWNQEIHIIPNGLVLPSNDLAVRPRWFSNNKKPFLIHIGYQSEKKQTHVILPAMRFLKDYNLYILGNGDTHYLNKLKRDIELMGLKNIYIPGEVTDSEKLYMLNHAAGLVFPSKAEGFGIPVLEGLMAGIPVITSDSSSLPEIGGGFTALLNSFDPVYMQETIIKQINKYNEDPLYRNQAICYAQSFSWSRAFYLYLDIYKSVLGK